MFPSDVGEWKQMLRLNINCYDERIREERSGRGGKNIGKVLQSLRSASERILQRSMPHLDNS